MSHTSKRNNFGDNCYASFCMPIDDESSNIHMVTCDKWRLGKDGFYYAYNPTMFHRDHDRVTVKGWIRFHKNTAVRSVSVKGVD